MWFIVALLICWLVITTTFCIIIYRGFKVDEDSKMSIRESMNLVNLPVVTFENSGNKYNFIVDTGANDSIIDKNCNIITSTHYINNDIIGIEGTTRKCNTVIINFNYKNTTFETIFNVIDLSDLFNKIKENYGVAVHGILGTNFLDKYNYVIDFRDYKIYRKK